jgi:transposase
MSLELSKEKCLAASGIGRAGHPIRHVTVPLSAAHVLGEIARARHRFGLPEEVPVVTVYEAGFSGFWLYRELTKAGVHCIVTKSSTLQRKRKGRTPKTDRIDAEALQKALIKYHRDGEDELRPVEVPGAEAEDLRQIHREREVLMKERNQHNNRIGSLLRLHGIHDCEAGALGEEELEQLRAANGEVLPTHTRGMLRREIVRRNLVLSQLQDLEEVRGAMLREGKTVCAQQCRQLMQLKGIGEIVALTLSAEVFSWRKLKNRRQVGHAMGLVGTPHQSGKQDRDQGISKSGNAQVRRMMVEAAWLWLRWQPGSALSQWFLKRFGVGKRARRIGIVALARRLGIALWRYLKTGVIPEGALLKGERGLAS